MVSGGVTGREAGGLSSPRLQDRDTPASAPKLSWGSEIPPKSSNCFIGCDDMTVEDKHFCPYELKVPGLLFDMGSGVTWSINFLGNTSM